MITPQNSLFVLVDLQERLANVVYEELTVIENLTKLVKGLQLLDVPILWLEQYPKGLGRTCSPLKELLEEAGETPIEKLSFSGYAHLDFQRAIESSGRKNILVAGMESHVCVYQTVKDLLKAGKKVELIADGISSRTAENREIGLKKMLSLGAKLSSTEMALFELLHSAENPNFKAISALIK